MDIIICIYKSLRKLCHTQELLFVSQSKSRLLCEYLEADLLGEAWGDGAEKVTAALMYLKT